MPSYLVKELFKFALIGVRLLLSPGRSGGGFLEAPVRCKDVIEEKETVFSSPHLKYLPQQTPTLIVIDRCQPPIFLTVLPGYFYLIQSQRISHRRLECSHERRR